MGFDNAYERLHDAIATDVNPDEIFVPIFDALHWVVAVRYYANKFNVPLSFHHDDWLALRYARNRANHQWGMALRLADNVPFRGGPAVDGRGSRRIEPRFIKDWLWIDDLQLPPPDPKYPDPKGQKAYIASLESHPAREVLQCFSAAVAPFR